MKKKVSDLGSSSRVDEAAPREGRDEGWRLSARRTYRMIGAKRPRRFCVAVVLYRIATKSYFFSSVAGLFDFMFLFPAVVVVVFFTLTDRASTIPSNIRGCQSGKWSQRGTKVNGSHPGDNPLLGPTGSKSRQKVRRLYKRWHLPITKRYIKPPLLHIESSLDRLGLLPPTHDQRSQQQIGQVRSNQF